MVFTLHLFAGAGGGLLADKLLGFQTVGAVEIDEFARNVLLSRQADGFYNPFPIWGDIRSFGIDPDTESYFERLRGIRTRLCIAGGFPCQDISAAGKGRGIAGEKSGLWKEFSRVIRDIRPYYVFIENSPLLIRRGIDVIIKDLASSGYSLAWRVISAGEVGAPHLRKRFWGLAISDELLQRERERFPTPTVNMARNSISQAQLKRHTLDLKNYVNLYPTPCTTGFPGCSGARKKVMETAHLSRAEKKSMCAGNGGILNPEWVEWIMGFPIGYTEI